MDGHDEGSFSDKICSLRIPYHLKTTTDAKFEKIVVPYWTSYLGRAKSRRPSLRKFQYDSNHIELCDLATRTICALPTNGHSG